MVRPAPPAVADRLQSWLEHYQSETPAYAGGIDEACAALVRIAKAVPRELTSVQQDIVCRLLNDAWTRVLAIVVHDSNPCPSSASADPPATARVSDRRAARLLAEIEANYANPSLKLTTVARQLAVSPSHLTHILRAATGRTFGGHLHAMRVAEARRLLVDSTLSVKEIASRVGYSTTTQLDRHFRKIVRRPPSVYRAALRQVRALTSKAPVPRARYGVAATHSLTQPQK